MTMRSQENQLSRQFLYQPGYVRMHYQPTFMRKSSLDWSRRCWHRKYFLQQRIKRRNELSAFNGAYRSKPWLFSPQYQDQNHRNPFSSCSLSLASPLGASWMIQWQDDSLTKWLDRSSVDECIHPSSCQRNVLTANWSDSKMFS